MDKGRVYVLGASRMMDLIDPAFFIGKTVIGCNFVYRKFPTTYTITRHAKVIKAWLDERPRTRLVAPEYSTDLGGIYFGPIDIKLPDEVFWSRSIAGTAIDYARYIGAKEIVIMGVDCTNDYMEDYKPMPGDISTDIFNRTNKNQTNFIVDYIKLKYKIPIRWIKQSNLSTVH